MIKSITNFLIIFFIFQQLKSQISQIDQNGYNLFCDKTIHISCPLPERTMSNWPYQCCPFGWWMGDKIMHAQCGEGWWMMYPYCSSVLRAWNYTPLSDKFIFKGLWHMGERWQDKPWLTRTELHINWNGKGNYHTCIPTLPPPPRKKKKKKVEKIQWKEEKKSPHFGYS